MRLLAVLAAALALPAVADARVGPGSRTTSESGQCTAGFVVRSGERVFLAQAAHCTTTGAVNATDGCTTPSRPVGTPIAIEGASRPGRLAWSSWLSMQARGERDEDTCAFNDLQLVEVDPADHAAVDPSVPSWGGPTALREEPPAFGSTALSYGSSSLRGDTTLLSPRQGRATGPFDEGWFEFVHFVTPAINGDSGSAVLDGEGRALGLVTQLTVTGDNRVLLLARALRYADEHGGFEHPLVLEPGDAAFAPPPV